ncbi:hypothetical protein ABXN37_25985 [Piscinibacter sakaiensis]|uniref:Uncharacterized protein n=1 Tax=Piscinibacter sakaiensis TaxID=1547922 RepID=A0A0K8P7D2_PISS1|nr:hypothetical protein [Piscinibacter sakaiensis]GAP38568.1 hypothetical protein ISF6_5026 [Piscinibacter sakaiensis]
MRLPRLPSALPSLVAAALAGAGAPTSAANVHLSFIGAPGSGTRATCELTVQARNGMGQPIRALVAEARAVHAASGQALGGGLNAATFSRLAPGATAETPVGTVNAPCGRVRLQPVTVQCTTRGCEPGLAQQGLAGIAAR